MLKEQITAFLGAETGLTEAHIEALSSAFGAQLAEAKLEAKVAAAEEHATELAALKEAHEADKAAAVELAAAKLEECVDVAVAEALKEHETRFVDADTVARVSNAINEIKGVFEKNGFVLNENAPLQEAQAKLEESKAEYNTLFERNTTLKEELANTALELEMAKRTIIFQSVTSGLADTLKEKVGALAEAVTFDSTEEFREGLKLIVEQAKSKAEVPAKKDSEDDTTDADDKDSKDKDGKGPMNESVIDAFGRPTKRLQDMTPAERQAYYRTAR
ncbi:prohead assembly (scaffolding) protein [Acidovorax phage ACP17]|uniref:Prohead assembly (Scaffolding) protein n=1 Tax=Acidovorax phage ACP17 TaxID=2010329 RepID=A0A218M2V7_9CAUD|nr:prohead assembly (scaffolding) protein [Acidovorax phage ACP17]ASD50377.1 prohead assembly (scaffolding) protein [Acidovorax phage ACP17]